jgi:hypothetical protein
MYQKSTPTEDGPRKIPLALGITLCVVWGIQAVQSYMDTGEFDVLQIIALLCALALVVGEITYKAPK